MKCYNCEEKIKKAEALEFEGDFYCQPCFNEAFFTCRDCSEIESFDNGYLVGDERVCQNCFDDHYNSCSECDRVIHNDDSIYCESCDSDYCSRCDSEYHSCRG